MFIVFLLFVMVGFAYVYSISDKIVYGLNGNLTSLNMSSSVGNSSVAMYEKTRSIYYGGTTGVLAPFLILLAFGSSLINRRQDVVGYLINAMVICLITPLLIYVFSDIITNFVQVSILDPNYIAASYFQNFAYILIANMLMSLLSFIFVIRGGRTV